MRVAVLGASGFMGRHLTTAFSYYDQFRVRGFSRNKIQNLEPYSNFFRDISQFDFVLNASVSYGRNSSFEAYQANLEFPLKVIDALVDAGVPSNFVNLDSFFTKFPIPFYSPLKAYSLTKSLFPDLAASRVKERGNSSVRFANFRIEHLYGPGDAPEKFVSWLRNQMQTGVEMVALTEGLQRRDFIHVQDAATLIIGGLVNFDQLDLARPLEIGTGDSMSLRSFIEIAAEVFGYRGELRFGEEPDRLGEIQHSEADPYLANVVQMRDFMPVREGLSLLG